MSPRIRAAVQRVREHRAQTGHWPVLPSPFVEGLDLTADEIGAAVETGVLRVVFPPAGPTARLEAP